MYAEKVAVHYDPHSNSEWGGGGSSFPTALSKVGKYVRLYTWNNTTAKCVKTAFQSPFTTHI